MNTDFVQHDNKLRRDRYQKDSLAEEFIKRMNEVLMPLEDYKLPSQKFPTIFIFGLPRSGTTLTYQLLAYSLDVGYVNNLIARFWLAPLHGIVLSQAIMPEIKDDSFISDYGKSVKINGPHEFAYFWHYWLNIKSVEDMTKFGIPNGSIRWDELGQVIQRMQNLFGKGMVYKTNFVANYLLEFIRTFSMPLIIYVERNPVDVGLSILNARKAYYGDYKAWWATYPPDYNSLNDIPFPEQIARQVFSLREVYSQELQKVDSNRVVRISYDEICQSPLGFIHSVRKKIIELYDFTIDICNLPPKKFNASQRKRDLTKTEVVVVKALEKYYKDAII